MECISASKTFAFLEEHRVYGVGDESALSNIKCWGNRNRTMSEQLLFVSSHKLRLQSPGSRRSLVYKQAEEREWRNPRRGCRIRSSNSRNESEGSDSPSSLESSSSPVHSNGSKKAAESPSPAAPRTPRRNRQQSNPKSPWKNFLQQLLAFGLSLAGAVTQMVILLYAFKMLRVWLPFQPSSRPSPFSQPRATTVSIQTCVPFSDFLREVKKNNVKRVFVDSDRITFTLRKPVLEYAGRLAKGSAASESAAAVGKGAKSVDEVLRKAGLTEKSEYDLELTTIQPHDYPLPYQQLVSQNVEFGAPDKSSSRLLNNISMAVLYGGILAALISRLPLNFPQKIGAKPKNSKDRAPPVVFADVAGVDEAKEELEEIVEYLRTPERFTRLGARPPRGVLLVGPPGTGKTLLAKAVAGEAEVPFISCSGSEFVELYVGLGASRVRDLFSQAKKDSPCIIFIDEIDAVAKVRDARVSSIGNDEREQTLNQLLTELDGFDSSTAIIVLAATNRADVLDPALRRPGRFDRIVAVEAPDRTGRMEILNVHLKKKDLPLSDNVDVKAIATATMGFTGADLANLVNEAALLAARSDREEVDRVDFDRAVERARAGIEKKRSALGSSEKVVVAHHEAGHALVAAAVAKIIFGQPTAQKISIVPRSGGALGFAYMPPPEGEDERQLLFIDEMKGQLVTLLGGRAAEEVSFDGRISTGALDDIRRATDLAYKAVAEFGLSSKLGPLSLGTLSGGGLDGSGAGVMSWGKDQGRLTELVQSEVQQMLQKAQSCAVLLLTVNRELLSGLGSALAEEETLEGDALTQWFHKMQVPEEVHEFVRGKTSPIL